MSAQYFSDLKISGVVDKKRDQYFSLAELEERLKVLKPACQFYLDPKADTYIKRSEKGNIDSYLVQMQSAIQNLVSSRTDNEQQFAANKQAWLDQFNANYDEVLDRLIRPYQVYSNSEDPQERLSKLSSLLTEAEKDAKVFQQKAADQANAAAMSADQTVGRYFMELLDDGRRLPHKYVAPKLRRQKKFIVLEHRTRGDEFGLNSGLNYVRRRWLMLSSVLLAFAVAVVVWIFKRHFDGNLTSLSTDQLEHRLLAAVPKILALIVVLLPLRFAIKNYNAASHQRTVYKHKSVAIRTLEGYTANMEEAKRNEVRQLVGVEIFETPETGYISRKDGAGSSEIPLEYLFGRITRE